tara:strand:+ start:2710 stop:3081 length:372 start_codon:yes stop_codon:yes gene_type:complete
MAVDLTLTFSAPLNTSCQVGDTAYWVDTSSSGGFTINSNAVQEIGVIKTINNSTSDAPTIVINTSISTNLHGSTKFVLFSKDNKANLSSMLGYYLSVQFKNNNASTDDAELFSVGVDTFLSSK